jgi:hypothetical protein
MLPNGPNGKDGSPRSAISAEELQLQRVGRTLTQPHVENTRALLPPVLGQVITWPSTLPPASWQELSCIEYPKGCRRME